MSQARLARGRFRRVSTSMYEIEYVVTADDVAYLNHYHAQKSPTIRHARLRGAALLVFLGMVVLMVAPSALLGLSVCTGLMVSAAMIAARKNGRPSRQQYEHIRRLFEEGNNRALFGPHRMLLHEDRLEVITEYSRGEVRWEGVERIEEDEQYIFIYVSALNAYVVHKKYFFSGHDAQRFIEHARHMHGRAMQLDPPPSHRALPEPPRHAPHHPPHHTPAPRALPSPAMAGGPRLAADGTDGDVG